MALGRREDSAPPEPNDPNPYVVALLREREHYVRRGRGDRVAEVDAELARIGHSSPDAAQPASGDEAENAASKDAPETTAAQKAPETTSPARPAPRRSTTNAED